MAEKSNLTIEERFTILQKAKQRPQTSPPKIQRVASYLRDRTHFAKHYSPKLVSIGPIHHGDTKLQLGEQYKLMWAAAYIERIRQTPRTLYKRIEDNINWLKDLFASDLFSDERFSNYVSEGFNNLDEKICWMLFVDGCSLLQILDKANLLQPDKMYVKVDQLVLCMQDVLLLENQLPYAVLKLLWTDTEAMLMKTMIKFLQCHHWAAKKEDVVAMLRDVSPTHLLDLQRRIILRDHANKENQIQIPNQDDTKENNNNQDDTKENNNNQDDTKDNNNDMVTYRNIKELKASGIRLKSSKTRRPRDVSFSHGCFAGKLTLPEIVVDDTTAATVLNLIAYEMCPDFENDYGICSFVAFLDSLIDHPDDVKALRSARILLNSLGSDEEVATLFNTISTDLVPDTEKYSKVRDEIEKHYRNKCKTWIAQGIHTYFHNPWAVIAFAAAVLALALTFVQTWIAVRPPKH